ncbi:MAG: hypothetical protein O3A53_19510 [Acidobacteria bacterium]|nr:hypothetical protein [Acidobacteriota bacterium]MDA1236970.1 hypothetical protein [Acidobacteriota bacterium]
MRALLALVGLVVLAALIVFSPNLIWLARSTARITNQSGRELRNFRLKVGERDVIFGIVTPGQSRFVFLPETGDATLLVVYSVGTRQITGCQEYVEGSMYHVNVVIGPDLESHCDVTLPLTDRLFWTEALGVRLDPRALFVGAP